MCTHLLSCDDQMHFRGMTPSQLSSVDLLPQSISISNFQQVRQHMRLGEHGGNHFKILIRDITPQPPCEPHISLEEIVRERVTSVEGKGIVNYFGLQRFGYRAQNPLSVLSHQIGLALLQGNHVRCNTCQKNGLLYYFTLWETHCIIVQNLLSCMYRWRLWS